MLGPVFIKINHLHRYFVTSAHGFLQTFPIEKFHDIRTRLILLAFPKGKASLLRRFFLYPTKAELLWEPYDVRFEIWISPGGVEPRPYEIRGYRNNIFPLGISAHWVKAQP